MLPPVLNGIFQEGRCLEDTADIKLVAIDLDGTLLDNDRKISQRAKEAIQRVRAQGVEVTLATGGCLPQPGPMLMNWD